MNSRMSASRGSMILIMAWFFGTVINYVFNVGLGWLLIPEEYGIYGVCSSILIILSFIISHGFPWNLAKFLSERVSEKEKLQIFKTSLTANLLMGLGVVSLFYLLYQSILPLEKETFNVLIQIILLIVLLNSIQKIYHRTLQGIFRLKEYASITLCGTTIKLFIGVGLVWFGWGVLGVLVGFLSASLLTLIIMLYWLRDHKFWEVDGWSPLRKISFALPVMFSFLGIMLIQNIDILFLNFLTDMKEIIGFYQSARIISRVPFYIAGSLMVAIFPFISRANGEERYSDIAIKYTLMFILPISIVFVIIPDSSIQLIYPSKYLPATEALSIIALGMGSLALIQVLANIFQAKKKPMIPAYACVGMALCQLILLYVLIPSYTINGAALATTISCFLGLGFLTVFYVQEFNPKFSLNKLIKLVFSFAIMSLFLVLLPHNGRIQTLADLFFSGIIYLLSLSLLSLITKEDFKIILSGLPENNKLDDVKEVLYKLVEKLNIV